MFIFSPYDTFSPYVPVLRAGLYPNHFAYDADLVEATRDAQQWLRNHAHGLLKTPRSTTTTQPTHTTHKTDDASTDDEIVSVDESRVTLTTSRQTLTLTTVCATAAEVSGTGPPHWVFKGFRVLEFSP
ncbi:hypothetical protein SARC_16083 [Sphaeroforma arctica JP610]|uniref:Uncharacterized protein n=1 Tax=Sphaeroforma arctica JP610 TaxID=667725 RepID=A0A0L0F445_9EUKA|nr:hypothetical protein SARC_16083 [Sphaeroforma arctica JP610]KNC71379.1 hypothetical protein SARC_16083 [Sphaeroforma arctica JP610]|eukprot:XP_014145281.1 hypothetical protein SARC_16083 [Sphaeroforma arctica JP610]